VCDNRKDARSPLSRDASNARGRSLLVELFGESATSTAIDEVMQTGHVGAEYVEYALRHKRGLAPQAPPLRVGDPVLDAISVAEPDLSRCDRLAQRTRDPGEPAREDQSDEEARIS
jgi:hypothetical protein